MSIDSIDTHEQALVITESQFHPPIRQPQVAPVERFPINLESYPEYEVAAHIFHISENPEFRDLPVEQQRQMQLQLIAERVPKISQFLYTTLLELGFYIREGDKLKLPIAPFSTMENWMHEGLGIGLQMLRLAQEKYTMWLLFRHYGLEPVQIANADPIQLTLMKQIHSTIREDIQERAKKQYEVDTQGSTSTPPFEALSRREKERVIQEVRPQFRDDIISKFKTILESPPDALIAETHKLGTGIMDRPLFIATMETLEPDKTISGNVLFTGTITASLSAQNIEALHANLLTLKWQVGPNLAYQTSQEFARYIHRHVNEND